MAQNYGLGRGLSSLIPQKAKKISEPKDDFNYFGSKAAGVTNNVSDVQGGVQEINIDEIIPNPHQPRLNFDGGKLEELASSIREHGIIQPLIVSKNKGQYEIIAGERRYQAAKMAGLKSVPAIVRDATEQQKLELAIIENIQRHDLNPIEEAKSYLKLIDEFDLTQEEVGIKLGKSRPGVANKLRLLTLPVEIQKALMEGRISEGHAKAVLAVSSPEKQRALFEMILRNNLTVRQTEDKTKEVSVKTHKRTISVDPETREVENNLTEMLGTKVKVAKSGSGGKIVIEYYSKEELTNILNKINPARRD